MISTNPDPLEHMPRQLAARAYRTAELLSTAAIEVAHATRVFSAEALFKLAQARDVAVDTGLGAAAGDFLTDHAFAAHDVSVALASVRDCACVFYSSESLLFGRLARDMAALWRLRLPSVPGMAPRVEAYLEGCITDALQADRALLLRVSPPTGCWWSSKWYTHDRPKAAERPEPPEQWDHLTRGIWEREALETLRRLEARLSLSGIVCLVD